MAAANPELVAQNVLEVPLYTLWDTARYLHLPVWTVLALSGRGRPDPPEWFYYRAWRSGPRWGDPDEENGFPFGKDSTRLSFCQLADLFVRGFAIQAVLELGRTGESKKDYRVNLRDIFWMTLENKSDSGNLFRNGESQEAVNSLVERFASRGPQINVEWVRKLIVRRIERVQVDAGKPMQLYPFSRDPAEDSPRMIVLNPQIRFGRPTVAGKGVPTDILIERFHAGEAPAELADDYGIPVAEVDEAIRYETLSHRTIFPLFFDW